MKDLDFSAFMKESKTPEGLARQKRESEAALRRSGQAFPTTEEVDTEEEEALPPPLKKERKLTDTRDPDRPSVEDSWARLREQHGSHKP